VPRNGRGQRKADLPGPERERRVRRGKNGRPQQRARKPGGWTKRARRIFLDHLAATCNVTGSAAAAGLHWSGAYAQRRSDPEFAEQWQAALETGYARLEAMLIDRAGGRVVADRAIDDGAGAETPTPPNPEGMDAELALNLLRLHRAPLKGAPRRPSSKPQRAGKEELVRALIRQLRVIRRRLEREEGE